MAATLGFGIPAVREELEATVRKLAAVKQEANTRTREGPDADWLLACVQDFGARALPGLVMAIIKWFAFTMMWSNAFIQEVMNTTTCMLSCW